MAIMNKDVKHPVGNVDAKPTNPGASQSVMPDMTNTGGMMQKAPMAANQKSIAQGPGKKSGMI